MKSFDAIVVGAGVIGLAIARKMAMNKLSVAVLEKNPSVGLETTFRNSAVLHSGIYYTPDSQKAKLCRKGQLELYQYLVNKKIKHKQLGKLIVAISQEQVSHLEKLYELGQKNGVNDLSLIDEREICRKEPDIKAVAALYAPLTGVVYGAELLQSLKNDVISHGGEIVCNFQVDRVHVSSSDFKVASENDEQIFYGNRLINSAGLYAQKLAKSIDAMPLDKVPSIYYAKGNYFKLNSAHQPFSHLIYPVPEKAGLGVHATIDVFGNLRFGPDVEWIDAIDYHVNPLKKEAFVQAIQTYYPKIKEFELIPEFSGIRPKYKSMDEQPQDFYIQGAQDHGIKGLVNLFGIESPGLTCCLAIADYVNEMSGFSETMIKHNVEG